MQVIIALGGILIWIMFVKSILTRIRIPALVGFLATGIFIRWANGTEGPIPEEAFDIFSFFGELGLITILFRVGLESNLKSLLAQVRRASVVWSANMVISGAVGFITAYYALGIHLIPSLFITAAFTATSVGVSVKIWEEMNILDSTDGKLLIDVAEMDDISAIFIMALLFSVAPVLHAGENASLVRLIPIQLAVVCLKFIGFAALCFLFAHFVEERMMNYFKNLDEPPPDAMIIVISFGFVIAALAALLGLSLAIGAFFAGLLFSRDPDCIKMESSFIPIYEFFSPFFLLGVGLDIDPATMVSGLKLGGVLLAAAVIGKFAANGFPVYFMYGSVSAALIGISMVPRAEITMVIMQTGLSMGNWAVPSALFNAMVFVAVGTCLISPFGVQFTIEKSGYKTEND